MKLDYNEMEMRLKGCEVHSVECCYDFPSLFIYIVLNKVLDLAMDLKSEICFPKS